MSWKCPGILLVSRCTDHEHSTVGVSYKRSKCLYTSAGTRECVQGPRLGPPGARIEWRLEELHTRYPAGAVRGERSLPGMSSLCSMIGKVQHAGANVFGILQRNLFGYLNIVVI